MVLQSIMTGLLTVVLFRDAEPVLENRRGRIAGALLWIVLAVAGAALLLWGSEQWVYLGLIVVWAAPVLAGTWWLGYARYLGAWRRYVVAWMVPSVYLWVWDAVAIGSGIWSISDRLTTGVAFGPLPIEEAVFFLLTNVLVVQGVLLFLGDEMA